MVEDPLVFQRQKSADSPNVHCSLLLCSSDIGSSRGGGIVRRGMAVVFAKVES